METSTFSKLITMPISLAVGLCTLAAVALTGLAVGSVAENFGVEPDVPSYLAVCAATFPALVVLTLAQMRLEPFRRKLDHALYRWRARCRPQVH